jgi:hypothetical protein
MSTTSTKGTMFYTAKIGDRRTVVRRLYPGQMRIGDQWLFIHTSMLVKVTQELSQEGRWLDQTFFLEEAIPAPTRWELFRAWFRRAILRRPALPRATVVTESSSTSGWM